MQESVEEDPGEPGRELFAGRELGEGPREGFGAEDEGVHDRA